MDMITPSAEDGKLTYQEQMTQKQHEFKYQNDLKKYSDKLETYYNNRERAAGCFVMELMQQGDAVEDRE